MKNFTQDFLLIAALLAVLFLCAVFSVSKSEAHDSVCAQFADLVAIFEATENPDALREELLQANKSSTPARMIVQRAANWVSSGQTADQAWAECIGESI